MSSSNSTVLANAKMSSTITLASAKWMPCSLVILFHSARMMAIMATKMA